MKSAAFAVLALAALSFSHAEDDGQYRPERYGSDDGSYKRGGEGLYYGKDGTYKVYTALDNAYKSLIQRNGKYNSIYSAVQPVYVKAYNPLQQQLLTPFVNYGAESSFDQDTFATSLAGVTYRPPVVPVVSTVSPFVYSTPKPIVYSAPSVSPIVYAASTPKPIVFAASTAKPIVYTPTANVHVPVYARSGFSNEQHARIVKQDQDVDANSYRYSFETENGINAAETGVVDANASGGGTRASGFYEYVGDDGLKYRVDYTADENGFHPSGAHLP